MSGRKINLEEILDSQRMAIPKLYLQGSVNMGKPIGDDYQKIINAMKEACRQTLELASENFEIEYLGGNSDINDFRINKQSILDTINQVE